MIYRVKPDVSHNIRLLSFLWSGGYNFYNSRYKENQDVVYCIKNTVYLKQRFTGDQDAFQFHVFFMAFFAVCLFI